MQPSIPDDLYHYYLPIATLGLSNQIANAYVYIVLVTGRRPLMPSRSIQHTNYSITLCCGVIIFTLCVDSARISRLDRWELMISVVGNLVLFLSYLVIARSSSDDKHTMQVKADPGPQANADGTSRTALVHENPDRGEMVIDDKTQASTLGVPCILDHKVVGAPESPVTQIQSEGAETQIHARSQTESTALVQTKKATETGATLHYFIFNMPGLIFVLTGLVSRPTHNLPEDWVHGGQIHSIIIITVSILLAATVLGTLMQLFRFMREQVPSNKEFMLKKGHNYSDCVLQCSAALAFFIVSFDKCFPAALAGDITDNTWQILGDENLPLVYMLITKLPALAL
ncbi:hypothetical protein F4680DRAFT_166354 [Xylaria scruposa]|nr:hypothetical protein F4680DRAFT_166354 [Xylaria scruposa]